MTIMPYLASSTFTLASIFVVLQYGMKFQTYQEEMWWKGSLIGPALAFHTLSVRFGAGSGHSGLGEGRNDVWASLRALKIMS